MIPGAVDWTCSHVVNSEVLVLRRYVCKLWGTTTAKQHHADPVISEQSDTTVPDATFKTRLQNQSSACTWFWKLTRLHGQGMIWLWFVHASAVLILPVVYGGNTVRDCLGKDLYRNCKRICWLRFSGTGLQQHPCHHAENAQLCWEASGGWAAIQCSYFCTSISMEAQDFRWCCKV